MEGMLSRILMEGSVGEEETASWGPNGGVLGGEEGIEAGGPALSAFSSMLDAESAYTISAAVHGDGGGGDQLPPSVGSSAACSPTSASVLGNLHHQVNFFFPPTNPIPDFDLSHENGYLESALSRGNGGLISGVDGGGLGDFGAQSRIGNLNLCPDGVQFVADGSNLVQLHQGRVGFGELEFQEDSLFFNRPLFLKPLDDVSSAALFQKRAALRKNLEDNCAENAGTLNLGSEVNGMRQESPVNVEDGERKRKARNGDDVEVVSTEGPDQDDYDDSDHDQVLMDGGVGRLEESVRNDGSSSQANSGVTGDDHKGKKKGLPAKNLLAERRRRKKLNDRLYMLRSVVPKISKMDRASILGDAVEYLKELMQKINDLQNELNLTPVSSSPITVIPAHIKEERGSPSAFSSSVPSPTGQPASVEVRAREGRAVNIHMFCGLRPGLLLSMMRAMDTLGLDIQQAIISCFNGFALDVFQAKQCHEGQDLHPEQIKAALLESVGFHGIR